jgi:hypothetical protein
MAPLVTRGSQAGYTHQILESRRRELSHNRPRDGEIWSYHESIYNAVRPELPGIVKPTEYTYIIIRSE